MSHDRDPSQIPMSGIDYGAINDQWFLMEMIANAQATKIPACLTVMSQLNDDLLGMAWDEPLRGACEEMMRDAAMRLGLHALALMKGTARLRELQLQRPAGGDEPDTPDNDSYPF